MRSIPTALLGFLTVFVSLFGFYNVWTLFGIYEVAGAMSVYINPPLNVIADTWATLSLVGLLIGVAFIVAGTAGIARRMAIWATGLSYYIALASLSIAQVENYFLSASFGGEGNFGFSDAIVATALALYLIISHSNTYFRSGQKVGISARTSTRR